MDKKYYISITIHDENAQNQKTINSLICGDFYQKHM